MSGCPALETLESYEKGLLPDGECNPIEHHLARCTDCCETMARLRTSDPDRTNLRIALSSITSTSAFPTGEMLTDVGREVGTDQPMSSSDDTTSDWSDMPDFETITETEETGGRPSPLHGTNASATGESSATGKPSRSSRWIIPDYERILLCGEGSYGSVWAVRDRVGVYRALKVLDLERMRKARIRCRERAALEAYCRKVKQHPYLVNIYHVGAVGPYLYYTMELADDRTTHTAVHEKFPANYRPLTLDKMVEGGRLQIDVAMEIARRLLRGLAKLHSIGLVHRDIKPSNIIFVNRHPKLADIGVLNSEDAGGRPIGTPRYMPPDRAMDKSADVYAFGKTLHEMLAGREPDTFPQLPDESLWGSMRWDLQRVSDVLVRACADNAADRYPDASAMLEDMEASTRLPFDSLFEELDEKRMKAERDAATRVTIPKAAVDITIALIHNLPWILAIIAIMYAIARLT